MTFVVLIFPYDDDDDHHPIVCLPVPSGVGYISDTCTLLQYISNIQHILLND